jgi:hypothetical protein
VWYGGLDGQCYAPTIPAGTQVTVIDEANGESTSCTLASSGPSSASVLIWMPFQQYQALEPDPIDQPEIQVEVTWTAGSSSGFGSN